MTPRPVWRSGPALLARLALVPAAAFAVHQLRYTLAFGSAANAVLARQGHAYLHSVVPWIVLLLAVAAGGFLRALGRALRGQTSTPRFAVSLFALWAACFAGLVAIYCAQELLEGYALSGHPVGLEGVFGYGGWWALPAAACVALVLAAILHGARWVLEELATRAASAFRAAPAAATRPRPAPVFLIRRPPLALGRAERGPPLLG